MQSRTTGSALKSVPEPITEQIAPLLPIPLRDDGDEFRAIRQRNDLNHFASFSFSKMGASAALHFA